MTDNRPAHQQRPAAQQPRGRRGEYLVVLQFAVVLLFILTPRWSLLETTEPVQIVSIFRWSGLIGGMLMALILGVLGARQMGTNLTPLPYPVADNTLVCHGVYGWVRHPLYSAQLFAGLGWTVFTLSASHLLVLALGFAFFNYKATVEERWLRERHPDYADYAARVKRLVPWLY